MRSAIALAVVAPFALAIPSHATAEETEIEAQTREVGLTVGHAYGCLAEDDERRETMRLASKAIYTMILQDLGSNIAYAYATSAGYGAAQPRDDAKCKELAERWEAVKDNFELSDFVAGGE